jgi:hypothetical protein
MRCYGRRGMVFACLLGALLLLPASDAFAGSIKVTLAGAGAGTVSGGSASAPKAIGCSNEGNPGKPGKAVPPGGCFVSVGTIFTEDKLLATAAPGYAFAGWSGSGGGACNEGLGSGSPSKSCLFTLGPLELASVTATFIPAPAAPIPVTGAAAAGANAQLVKLNGELNPHGYKLASCRFEYDTGEYGSPAEAAHGETLPCTPGASELGEGTEAEAVSAEVELEPLKPSTTYHYRLVASNIGGAAEGEDRTFTTGPAPPDGCPNAAIRDKQEFGAIALPDCMALEMVSPPQKAGQPATSPAISANGDGVLFESAADLGETAGIHSTRNDPYVARRGSSGWTTAATSPPAGYVKSWDRLPAQSFTPDFSRWFDIDATQPQFVAGIDQAFQASLGGSFSPLSPLLDPLAFHAGEVFQVIKETEFQGASTDHSHLYFVPGPANVAGAFNTAYLPGDPEPGPNGSGADRNTYVARLDPEGRPSLELLARDRQEKLWGGSCGAHLGGIETPILSGTTLHDNGSRNQGAVSADGSRVYFSTRPTQPNSGNCQPAANKLRILVRSETGQGIQIEQLFGSECNRPALPDPPGPCEELSGDDNYQGASADGTRVYFTTNRQLASSDGDGTNAECSDTVAVAGCDLYLYDSTRPPGQRLVQVSAGETDAHHEAGEEAGVYNGIAAISGDGSHVYFVAAGVLTEHPNPAGETAREGEPNLYLWDAETEATGFIGTLAAGDGAPGNSNGLWGSVWGTWRNGAYPVPVQGSGHVLLFQTDASLSANDTDGGRRDIYRYDAVDPPTLECVSCLGGDDGEPFDVTGVRYLEAIPGTDFAEEHRWASEDGQSVVFKTAEPLVPGDVDGVVDSYLWREGRFFRLPGTADASGHLLDEPVLSGEGSELAFQSFSQLLPSDGDSALDIYAARAGGGFAEPEPPKSCDPLEEGSCRRPEAAPPAPAAASQAVTAGNVKPPPSCRKGKVRRRGRCVSKHPKRNRRKRTRPANANRRAAK